MILPKYLPDTCRSCYVLSRACGQHRPTLMERVEDITGELYSLAADEHNLYVATNGADGSDERYLRAYNLMTEVINILEESK